MFILPQGGRLFKNKMDSEQNSKHQIPNSKQFQRSNDRNLHDGMPDDFAFWKLVFIWDLKFGAYLGFGAWNLEFMIHSPFDPVVFWGGIW
jgi:hypothetical protein